VCVCVCSDTTYADNVCTFHICPTRAGHAAVDRYLWLGSQQHAAAKWWDRWSDKRTDAWQLHRPPPLPTMWALPTAFHTFYPEISWLWPKAEVLCSLILGTGKSVVKALEVLSQHKVDGRKVIVLTLFVTPESKFINCQRLFNICKRAIVIRN